MSKSFGYLFFKGILLLLDVVDNGYCMLNLEGTGLVFGITKFLKILFTW